MSDALRNYVSENPSDLRKFMSADTWYAHSVHNAITALQKQAEPPPIPGGGDPALFDCHDTAMAWLADEETNLEHAMRTTADSGLHDTAWYTGHCPSRLYSESGRNNDCVRTTQRPAASASKAGNRSAEARALSNRGWAYAELARRRPGASALLDEAEARTRRAVDLCGQAGDEHGNAYALNGLAKVPGNQSKYAEALDSYGAALAIYQAEGNRVRVGSVHGNIGTIHFLRKHYDLALASYQTRGELPASTAAGQPIPGLVLDIDASIVICHSDKQSAAATWKHTFGYHPLLCFLDATGEALAGLLRSGNAGSNTTADHITVLDRALE